MSFSACRTVLICFCLERAWNGTTGLLGITFWEESAKKGPPESHVTCEDRLPTTLQRNIISRIFYGMWRKTGKLCRIFLSSLGETTDWVICHFLIHCLSPCSNWVPKDPRVLSNFQKICEFKDVVNLPIIGKLSLF